MRPFFFVSMMGCLGPLFYACGGSSSSDDDAGGQSGRGGSAGGGAAGRGGTAATAGKGQAGKGGARGGNGGTSNAGGANLGGEGGDTAGASGASGAGQGGAPEMPGGTAGMAGAEAGASGHHDDAIYDVAIDFSTTMNPTPNGFSYGWKPTRTGSFELYPEVGTTLGDGRVTWHPTESIAYLLVGYNPTSENLGGTAPIGDPPLTAFFHPGPNGENSVVRWTCPDSRNYRIDGTFDPRDNTTTTVAILKNNTLPELFTADVTVDHPAAFAFTIALADGDTIDFSVDYGPNGNNYYDNTGIAATITAE
jgi:hypothetical protein